MSALAAALLAALGVHFVYTSLVLRWRGLGLGPQQPARRRRRARLSDWLAGAGLSGLRLRDLAVTTAVLFVAGVAVIYGVFGAIAPAIAVGVFAATYPWAAYQRRRRARRLKAQDAWPRLLEELRILTSSLGRSIPQALFEVGRRAPDSLSDGFAAAHREWVISTDFPRTVAVLKRELADPTADTVCETLLVAHTLGGTDLDRRLGALIEDRIQDTQGRKDARAKQAGARFSRRFVLFVPFGMALAGMSVGDGREAYSSTTGQLLTLVAVGMVVACWVWSGQILRLRDEHRVFSE